MPIAVRDVVSRSEVWASGGFGVASLAEVLRAPSKWFATFPAGRSEGF